MFGIKVTKDGYHDNLKLITIVSLRIPGFTLTKKSFQFLRDLKDITKSLKLGFRRERGGRERERERERENAIRMNDVRQT